jgi:signal transduction histidine kinase
LKNFRHALLVLFFVGLAALEIAHGVFRIHTIRQNQHQNLLAGIERGHVELSREVRAGLEEAREHAAYLARLPAVRNLLRAPLGDSGPRRALEEELLPYVVSFRRIDRVRVLDPEGKERFRSERIGKGVGVLPEALLEREPDTAMLLLTRDAPPGEVVHSTIGLDAARVEVPPSDRQVLHFATAVAGGEPPPGTLALTVYASPILNQVRRFSPVPGVFSVLIGDDGAYLASQDRSREEGGKSPGNFKADFPEAAQRVLSGNERVRAENAVFLSLFAGDRRLRWRLVTCVPDASLDAASSQLRGEYAWVVGAMVLTTLVLIFSGAFFVRMSLREVKLQEAARYERQQKELERQVQMSERLGSLGLLTAGVAHEINNPLEGIENYLALLEREPVSPEKRKRYLEMIRYGFHRIRDIVRDLSTFARPGKSEGSADLGKVIDQSLKMVRYTKEFKEVTVLRRGLESPLVIPGDPGRLEQVFINLFLNAAKAMHGQGNLSLEARRTGAESPQVEIVVEDDGPGIPKEALAQIFDPFFTTSDGTGLGLSISYGIVCSHGGRIVAENRPQGGARFILTLPAREPVVLARRGGKD